MRRAGFILVVLLLCSAVVLAQRYRGGRRGGEGWIPEDAPIKTARDVPTHSYDMPEWTNSPAFQKDVFTFARVRYSRDRYRRSGGYCFTDFPDSDLNFSYRLQQLTSLKVDPAPRVISLTEEDLFEHPFIYMVEPGALRFEEEEVEALQKYFARGGFMMVDDFWGTEQWENLASEMKRVFPDRAFVDLPVDHPVFRTVIPLKIKHVNELQTPNFRTGEESQYTGVTWEYHDGEACINVHIRAILDDKGRIMVIACHNTDNGDGWEREQEHAYFFRQFSENRAYPLGINIVFYAMTH